MKEIIDGLRNRLAIEYDIDNTQLQSLLLFLQDQDNDLETPNCTGNKHFIELKEIEVLSNGPTFRIRIYVYLSRATNYTPNCPDKPVLSEQMQKLFDALKIFPISID